MKRLRISKWIVIALVLVFGYFITDMLIDYSNVEQVSEPTYYKNLFVENTELKHFESETLENGNVYSIYNYSNLDVGILVFRQKTDANNLDEVLNFKNETVSMPRNQFYKGSIFRDYLKYKFRETGSVNNLTFYHDNFRSEFIKSKKKNFVHLIFPMESNVGLQLDSEDKLSIFAKKKDVKSEINNFVILMKEGYLYFVYAKPISGNGSNFSLQDIMVSP